MSFISVVVVLADGKQYPVILKPNTAVCEQLLRYEDLVGYLFLYDCSLIKPNQTIRNLQMQEGDMIDAVLPETNMDSALIEHIKECGLDPATFSYYKGAVALKQR